MRLRVILVDDDARFRVSARRALVAEGIDVVAVLASGAEVVDAVERLRPDVALIDIQMPGMDGLDVARRLKERDHGPAVILISTRDQAYGDRLAAGLAAGYLPKDELALGPILARAQTAD